MYSSILASVSFKVAADSNLDICLTKVELLPGDDEDDDDDDDDDDDGDEDEDDDDIVCMAL